MKYLIVLLLASPLIQAQTPADVNRPNQLQQVPQTLTPPDNQAGGAITTSDTTMRTKRRMNRRINRPSNVPANPNSTFPTPTTPNTPRPPGNNSNSDSNVPNTTSPNTPPSAGGQ